MAIPVIMPKQGQSVETCIITKWFRQKGELVRKGDILFSYETDKASFDMESPDNGTLLEIFYNEGSEVPILVNVALIGNPGEDISSFLSSVSESPEVLKTSQLPVEEKISAPEVSETADPIMTGRSKTRISPRAKRLAIESGIEYKIITGSGPYGRIVYSDVQDYISAGIKETESVSGLGTEFTEQPISNVRRIISKAMHSSLQNSAQLTHHMSADVRKLLETRSKIKVAVNKGIAKQDITLNDMICWCVIRALKKFPEVNTHFLSDRIKIFNRVHLGIAVDTPRGLMVPVVRNADEMDLDQLSSELKSVAESCRKGNINPELLQSTAASFTVSNLGNYGVEMFTPVVNLPQTSILGVCTIMHRPADLGNNTFGFIPFMGLSLTYDHRAIDGGPATLFLKEIKEQIENFSI